MVKIALFQFATDWIWQKFGETPQYIEDAQKQKEPKESFDL